MPLLVGEPVLEEKNSRLCEEGAMGRCHSSAKMWPPEQWATYPLAILIDVFLKERRRVHVGFTSQGGLVV